MRKPHPRALSNCSWPIAVERSSRPGRRYKHSYCREQLCCPTLWGGRIRDLCQTAVGLISYQSRTSCRGRRQYTSSCSNSREKLCCQALWGGRIGNFSRTAVGLISYPSRAGCRGRHRYTSSCSSREKLSCLASWGSRIRELSQSCAGSVYPSRDCRGQHR